MRILIVLNTGSI